LHGHIYALFSSSQALKQGVSQGLGSSPKPSKTLSVHITTGQVIKNAKNKLTGNRLFRERYESIQKQIEGLKEQNEKHQVNLLLEKQPNACTLTLSNGFNLVQEGRVLLFQLYHEKEHSEDLLTFLSALLSECLAQS